MNPRLSAGGYRRRVIACVAAMLFAVTLPCFAFFPEPYPRSEIVESEDDDRLLPRQFVLGPVGKIRRDVRVDDQLEVPATRRSRTYEMSGRVTLEEVIEHYRAQLDADAVFVCRGRDCGRSNHWANGVFDLPLLYGPDRKQFYIAAVRERSLVSVYAIERGNQRLYAHVVVMEAEEPVAVDSNRTLVSELAGSGFVRLSHVEPSRLGQLGDDALAALRRLGGRLDAFPRQRIYVVCHLYGFGSEPVDELTASSLRCAQAAVDALQQGLGDRTADGPELEPRGLGPLAPVDAVARSRVELVLPSRLERE